MAIERITAQGDSGVVASLTTTADGKYRLSLDDVTRLPMLDATAWKHSRPFTSHEYDKLALENLNLSKEELAMIGENIVIRLIALAKGRGAFTGYDPR